MNLPIEAINEFKEIYQRKIGVTLTFNEAKIRAEKFLRLMILITKKPNAEINNLFLNKNEK